MTFREGPKITGDGNEYKGKLDGRKTQRIGIVPDIVVKPTIHGIKNWKDEVLEKAIEIVNQSSPIQKD